MVAREGVNTSSGLLLGMVLVPARLVLLVLVMGLAVPAGGSEFPERECCDSIPPLPAQFTTPPVSVATSSSRAPSPTTQKTTAVHLGTVSTTINCKLARQLCVNDAACHSITTLIPRLCGQELVACSTVTVTKCTAALRTLVAFQFFQPTCLCKEPRVDPECNTYRSLLFDHPCFTVKNEHHKDPYPVHALPTCQYALDACRRQGHCSGLYDNFVRSCDFDASKCLMTDSRACYDAWNQLRLSPVFGCICPNGEPECEQIFNLVHRNPCVDDLPEHRRSAAWHSTHYRLHRLLLPPRSAPPAWRRPSAPAPPTPPARRRPPAPRTPARSRTVASSRVPWQPLAGPPESSQRRVSVDELAGGGLDGSRRPADAFLVTPLFDLTSEPTHTSTLPRTLYGPPEQRRPTGVRVHQPPRYHVSIADSPPGDDVFRSTCHEARSACLAASHCGVKLQPVLSACDERNCNRQICMQRLQNFYRGANTSLSMEVAFCVCRRAPDGSGGDSCVRALNELHPKCAQKPEGGVLPACHSVAEQCRNDPSGLCRPRLEQYEQACAVDSVTNLCAGPTADCRVALLAVLGTELRTNCACKGTDISSMYDCRGWERLLFGNPCVVQAQREFHRQRQEDLRTPPPRPPPPRPTPPPYRLRPIPTTPARRWRPTTTTTTPSTARSTSRRTSTARTTTTTRRWEEVAHCVSRKQGRAEDRIAVGEGIRYYKQDEEAGRDEEERDCSELCMCHAPNRITCNVLECVAKEKCKTSVATYHDGSAGLLPYRAGCICFHGQWVCMRPPPNRYTLPFGVFLFMGYSRQEEELLGQYTRKSVHDNTVEELKKVLDKITQRNQMALPEDQKWPCKLSLTQQFPETENIIIQAKIDDVEASYNNSLSKESLDREKRECSQPLREISFMINNREPMVVSHPLLSVFKMADVEVTIPDTSGSSHCAANAARLLALAAAALLVR